MTRWLYVAWGLTLLALGVSLYVYVFEYNRLPEQVPTHWGIDGKPDGFTPRDQILGYLLLVPAMMAGVVLLSFVLPWLSPKHFEIDRFRDTFQYLIALITGFFCYLHVAILFGCMNMPMNMTQLILGGTFVFFALLGNVLGKVRRNFYVGVRTPWTLASDKVWEATHRLSAYLWTAGGIAGLVGMLVGVPVWACFIGVMVVILIPVPYSLILYKRLEREGKLDVETTAGAANR